MIKRFISFKDFFHFVGGIPLIYISIGFTLSLILGMVEFYFALSLQLFLKFIGLLNDSIQLGAFSIKIDSLGELLIFMSILLLVRFIIQIVQSQTLGYAAERVNFRLKSILVYDFLFGVTKSSHASSEIFFKFNEVIPKSVNTINVSVQLLASLIQMMTFLIIMFSTLYKETLVSLFGVLLIGLLTIYIATFLKKVSRNISNESHSIVVKIQKSSRNLLFFKLMRLNEDERRNLTGTQLDLSNYVLRSTLLTSIATGAPSLLGGTLLIGVVYLGKNYWHSSGPALITFLYLLVKFVQSLSVLSGQFAVIQNFRHQFFLSFAYFQSISKANMNEGAKYEAAIKFFGKSEHSELLNEVHSSSSPGNVVKNISLPSIQLENVIHHYGKNSSPTFSSLSLSLEGGEHLGIVGMSGSGKSTLLMLIMGVLEPTQGKILISGENPKKYFENIENRIGYVGAEPYLFKGTLKENLTYGIKRDITQDEILSALKISRLEKFYLSVGPDYHIEEDLSGLSAGQKQRLCLARALLNKPHLLVLDEATANLDKQTEEEIALDILKLKNVCTVLVVSHQPGMLKFVDKVVSL